jgi:hypothetical protein
MPRAEPQVGRKCIRHGKSLKLLLKENKPLAVWLLRPRRGQA